MGAEGIGQFIGALLRANPKLDPAFQEQVNKGLVPDRSPFLPPSSGLKRVFGNNADDLNSAYALALADQLQRKKTAMDTMVESSKLKKGEMTHGSDLNIGENVISNNLRGQLMELGFNLDEKRDTNQFIRQQARDESLSRLGTRADRERQQIEQENLDNQTGTSAVDRRLLGAEKLQQAINELKTKRALVEQNPEWYAKVNAVAMTPPGAKINLGMGDTVVDQTTGEIFSGSSMEEVPGAINPITGIPGPSTRRMNPPGRVPGKLPLQFSPQSPFNLGTSNTGGGLVIEGQLSKPSEAARSEAIKVREFIAPTQAIDPSKLILMPGKSLMENLGIQQNYQDMSQAEFDLLSPALKAQRFLNLK